MKLVKRKSRIPKKFLEYKWGARDLCIKGKICPREWDRLQKEYNLDEYDKWHSSFQELWEALCDYLSSKTKKEKLLAEEKIQVIRSVNFDFCPLSNDRFIEDAPDEVLCLFDVFWFIRRKKYEEAYKFLSKPVRTYRISFDEHTVTAHSESDAIKRFKSWMGKETLKPIAIDEDYDDSGDLTIYDEV